MLTVRVIEGHNKFAIAKFKRDGIRYRGKTYTPIAVRRLDEGASDAATGIAGGVIGGALLGPAGLVAGSVIGGAGRTAVLIATAEGPELIGTVPSAEYAELYVEVRKLKEMAETRAQSTADRSARAPEIMQQEPRKMAVNNVRAAPTYASFGHRLLAGPFYFERFGVLWFLFALAAVLLTYGIAWLALPFIAGFIHDYRNEPPVAVPIPAADTTEAPVAVTAELAAHEPS